MASKTSVAPTEPPRFCPELFRYEAFNSHEAGGLTTVLHALEKLSRLSALAQRGVRADDIPRFV